MKDLKSFEMWNATHSTKMEMKGRALTIEDIQDARDAALGFHNLSGKFDFATMKVFDKDTGAQIGLLRRTEETGQWMWRKSQFSQFSTFSEAWQDQLNTEYSAWLGKLVTS